MAIEFEGRVSRPEPMLEREVRSRRRSISPPREYDDPRSPPLPLHRERYEEEGGQPVRRRSSDSEDGDPRPYFADQQPLPRRRRSAPRPEDLTYSESPVRRRRSSPAPVRIRRRSPSPVRIRRRSSSSPVRFRRRSPSPVRVRRRRYPSPSPERWSPSYYSLGGSRSPSPPNYDPRRRAPGSPFSPYVRDSARSSYGVAPTPPPIDISEPRYYGDGTYERFTSPMPYPRYREWPQAPPPPSYRRFSQFDSSASPPRVSSTRDPHTLPRSGYYVVPGSHVSDTDWEDSLGEDYPDITREVEKEGLSISLPLNKGLEAVHYAASGQELPVAPETSAWRQPVTTLGDNKTRTQLMVVQASEYSTDETGVGRTTLVCPSGPRTLSIDASTHLQWLHVQQPALRFKPLERLVLNCPSITEDARSIAMETLEKVQEQFTGTSECGPYLEPGSVLRYVGTKDTPPSRDRQADADVPVVFLAAPFLALAPYLSRRGSDTEYRPRSLLQSLYGYDVGIERESGQVVQKLGVKAARKDLLHINQLWCLLIGSDVLITMSEQSAAAIRGDSILVNDRSPGTQEPLVVRLVDKNDRSYPAVIEPDYSFAEFLKYAVALVAGHSADPSMWEIYEGEDILTPSRWVAILESERTGPLTFSVMLQQPEVEDENASERYLRMPSDPRHVRVRSRSRSKSVVRRPRSVSPPYGDYTRVPMAPPPPSSSYYQPDGRTHTIEYGGDSHAVTRGYEVPYPHTYAGPSHSYAGPSPYYAGPSHSYAGPSPSYAGPSPSYARPSPSYAGRSRSAEARLVSTGKELVIASRREPRRERPRPISPLREPREPQEALTDVLIHETQRGAPAIQYDGETRDGSPTRVTRGVTDALSDYSWNQLSTVPESSAAPSLPESKVSESVEAEAAPPTNSDDGNNVVPTDDHDHAYYSNMQLILRPENTSLPMGYSNAGATLEPKETVTISAPWEDTIRPIPLSRTQTTSSLPSLSPFSPGSPDDMGEASRGREAPTEILDAEHRLSELLDKLTQAEQAGDFQKAADLKYGAIPEIQHLIKTLKGDQPRAQAPPPKKTKVGWKADTEDPQKEAHDAWLARKHFLSDTLQNLQQQLQEAVARKDDDAAADLRYWAIPTTESELEQVERNLAGTSREQYPLQAPASTPISHPRARHIEAGSRHNESRSAGDASALETLHAQADVWSPIPPVYRDPPRPYAYWGTGELGHAPPPPPPPPPIQVDPLIRQHEVDPNRHYMHRSNTPLTASQLRKARPLRRRHRDSPYVPSGYSSASRASNPLPVYVVDASRNDRGTDPEIFQTREEEASDNDTRTHSGRSDSSSSSSRSTSRSTTSTSEGFGRRGSSRMFVVRIYHTVEEPTIPGLAPTVSTLKLIPIGVPEVRVQRSTLRRAFEADGRPKFSLHSEELAYDPEKDAMFETQKTRAFHRPEPHPAAGETPTWVDEYVVDIRPLPSETYLPISVRFEWPMLPLDEVCPKMSLVPFLQWQLKTGKDERTQEDVEKSLVSILSTLKHSLSKSVVSRLYSRTYDCSLEDVIQRHEFLREKPAEERIHLGNDVPSKVEDNNNGTANPPSVVVDDGAATTGHTPLGVDGNVSADNQAPQETARQPPGDDAEVDQQEQADDTEPSFKKPPSGLGAPSAEQKQSIQSTRHDKELMRRLFNVSTEIFQAYIPDSGGHANHHVCVRFWGAVDEIFRQVIWDVMDLRHDPGERFAVANFDNPAKQLFVQHSKSWASCPACSGKKQYTSPDAALLHLHQHHFDCSHQAERPHDDPCFVWIYRDWGDNYVPAPKPGVGNLRHLEEFLGRILPVIGYVRELHALVASAGQHSTKVRPPLPSKVVYAFQEVVSMYVIQAHLLSFYNRRGSAALRQRAYINAKIEQLIRQEEECKGLAYDYLQDAKKDIILMKGTARHIDGLGVESVGAEFLLMALMANLQNRPVIENTPPTNLAKPDFIRLYQRYVSELRFEANRRPKKRVFLDIHALEEELDALQGLVDSQETVLANYLKLLSPGSLRTATWDRIGLFKIERDFGRRQQKILRAKAESIRTLREKSQLLKEQVKQTIEILEEDHGKAIRVFTFVTLLFLPLSFVTSFMGMNVTDIRETEFSQKIFWATGLPVTLSVVILAVLYAYRGEALQDWVWRTLKPRRMRGGRNVGGEFAWTDDIAGEGEAGIVHCGSMRVAKGIIHVDSDTHWAHGLADPRRHAGGTRDPSAWDWDFAMRKLALRDRKKAQAREADLRRRATIETDGWV